MAWKALFVLAAAGSVVAASAQVTEVGQFTGEMFDDFNSYTTGMAGPAFTFLGGNAVNTSPDASDIWVSDNHGLGGSKASYNSSQAMVANNGNANSPWTITFSAPVQAFGGFWQSAYDDSSLTFQFFDASNTALNTITKTPSNSGELEWYGFSWSGGIKSVLVTSDTQYQIVDNFTATAVPEPATMAALGLGLAAVARRRRRK